MASGDRDTARLAQTISDEHLGLPRALVELTMAQAVQNASVHLQSMMSLEVAVTGKVAAIVAGHPEGPVRDGALAALSTVQKGVQSAIATLERLRAAAGANPGKT